MAYFQVGFVQRVYESVTISVEAESAEKAEEIARTKLGDAEWQFLECDSDYPYDVEVVADETQTDGTSGQDRDSYSDDQDRDSYAVE